MLPLVDMTGLLLLCGLVWCLSRCLAGCRSIFPVKAKKYLLEAGLVSDYVDHRVPGRLLDERVEASFHREMKGGTRTVGLHHTWNCRERFSGHGAVEDDIHAAQRFLLKPDHRF